MQTAAVVLSIHHFRSASALGAGRCWSLSATSSVRSIGAAGAAAAGSKLSRALSSSGHARATPMGPPNAAAAPGARVSDGTSTRRPCLKWSICRRRRPSIVSGIGSYWVGPFATALWLCRCQHCQGKACLTERALLRAKAYGPEAKRFFYPVCRSQDGSN
jgi:hypothetical protein